MKAPSFVRRLLAPGAAVLVVCSSAFAGISPPVLTLDLQVFSKADTSQPVFDEQIVPTLTGPLGPPENFVWNYTVGETNSFFTISGGSINASPFTSPTPAFLNPALNFINNSSESLWFVMRLSMPVAQTLSAPLDWTSSASLSVSVETGAELRSLDDTPIWTVGVDNTPLGSAHPDPTVLNVNQSSLTENIAGSLADPVTSFMYIDIAFKLTPGSTGGVNGNFFMHSVPAPGALALLGIGGLLGGTRRRRAD